MMYMAPEALKGSFNAKSDVFSVAAILYTMLYGFAPWDCGISEKTPYYSKKITVQHAREAPLFFPNHKPDDPEIIDLLERGLRFDPAGRPSAAEFLEMLSAGCAPQSPALSHNQATRRRTPDKPQAPQTPQEPPQTPSDQTEKPREDSVQLEARKGKPGDGGFADVAGMSALKQELINRVIWVLKDKEKAARYRLTPPNGMLLYGPPGCGKTFFAKKFAEESGFNYYLVNGSDLGSTYIHGTQGKIADLFKKAAQNAPSVICFDEFDAFVPARGSDSARHRADEVNEFLSQLNNCSERGIFVIGTTNRMDMIDPAVLRKGRLDLKYEIPAPDAETRRAMLELYLHGRPVDGDLNLDKLTQLTEGYASSDIAFIVNESAMVAALADQGITQQILEESINSNPSSLSAPKRVRIGFDSY
ncbi:MAG: AAA family ATPase [Bacteroidales bacterium]|nr:AAA family ATPase [Bacteroidales bacterium]